MDYKIFIYDIEVLIHDWLVVFKEYGTDNYTVINNNNYEIKQFIREHKDDLLCGFNSKWYDDYVLLGMYLGADNDVIKKINDHIISGQNGWEYPLLHYQKKPFFSMDLRDDLDKGLSLKEIEGNLLLNIVESSIGFDTDHKLNDEEMNELIEYCKHDVDATELLFKERANYINAKKVIAKLDNINERFALCQTNAKLTAIYLEAEKVNHSLEEVRDYFIPSSIKQERIPKEVLNFYARLKDKSIPIKELIGSKEDGIKAEYLDINVLNCPVRVSYGGIHGASGNDNINIDEISKTNGEEWLLLNYDVTSLYPSAWINYDYGSRNIPHYKRGKYKKLRDMRVASKKDNGKVIIEEFNLPKDSDVAGGLKLPINIAYGAEGQKWNNLYDPLMAKSICITNQLAMLDLCYGLIEKVPKIDYKNINTDGIMFLIPKKDKQNVLDVIKEWEQRTGYELEEDNIKRYISKDVNNYFMEFTNGKVKAKGNYIGRYKKGSFDKNTMIIVQKAVVNYLDKGIDPKETIEKCNDIFQFQIITKMGRTYSKCYHEVNNQMVEVQRVNRVYPTKDKKYGKLYKFKVDKGKERYDSVASLPDHCIVDNANELTISDIDKQFYIDVANQRINDFVGEKTTIKKGTSTMANNKELTITQKLSKARLDFINENVKKTGKNRHLAFMYYTLDDIVPTATKILDKYDLVCVIKFPPMTTHDGTGGTELVGRNAIAEVIDGDNKSVEFSVPFVIPTPIYNKDGVAVNNPVQDLGSSITYLRRYLWMLVLDITEHDVLDEEVGSTKKEEKVGTKKAQPKNEVEKKEIAKEVINKKDTASDLSINAIKKGLKKLQLLSENNIPYIKDILVKIKKGLTTKEAESILIEINNKLEEE